MVRIHPDPPLRESARVQGWAVRRKGGPDGAVAQLGERLLCKQEVVGSIPFTSTNPEGRESLEASELLVCWLLGFLAGGCRVL